MAELEHKQKEDILILTLNRPEKRNALTFQMMEAVVHNLRRAADPDIRCVLIMGEGGNFCAGRDLGAICEDTNLEYLIKFDDTYTAIFQELVRLPKPTIAAVQGYAVGGGFSLAMGCDFLIAHSNAQFGCLEMKRGFPAAINIALLSHHLGRRKALEIAMTGEIFAASTLNDIGLINQLVHEKEHFDEAAIKFAENMAKLDPLGVKFTKETFKAVESIHLEDALVVGKQLNLWLASSGKIAEVSRNGQRSKENVE